MDPIQELKAEIQEHKDFCRRVQETRNEDHILLKQILRKFNNGHFDMLSRNVSDIKTDLEVLKNEVKHIRESPRNRWLVIKDISMILGMIGVVFAIIRTLYQLGGV